MADAGLTVGLGGSREEVVIEPRREPGEPEVRGAGLLLINPLEVRLAGKLAQTAGWRRHATFPGQLQVPSEGKGWLLGPAMGGPLAVMALEKIIALGAEAVISVGWCGSLQPELVPGAILLPTEAVSEEGTSAHYPLSGGGWQADESLRRRLAANLTGCGFSVQVGPVWTTDAPYRETRAKVAAYRRRGICGVEMEFAALARVAQFRQVPLASVLLVSDLLPGDDESWEPAFRRRDFADQSRRLLEALWGLW